MASVHRIMNSFAWDGKNELQIKIQAEKKELLQALAMCNVLHGKTFSGRHWIMYDENEIEKEKTWKNTKKIYVEKETTTLATVENHQNDMRSWIIQPFILTLKLNRPIRQSKKKNKKLFVSAISITMDNILQLFRIVFHYYII